MSGYGAREMAAAFRTVRANTLKIATEIPEASYTWAPAPGVRTVEKVLTHIALSPGLYEDMHREKRVTTLKGYDFGAVVGTMMAAEAMPRTKAEVIALLTERGERFAGWLDGVTPEFLAETYTDPMGQNARTRLEGLLSPKEHEMHHRGQLMLAQRLLGQVPHLTRQMQERMAAQAAKS
jgi:uncharacterized damage-inducible protein DinB